MSPTTVKQVINRLNYLSYPGAFIYHQMCIEKLTTGSAYSHPNGYNKGPLTVARGPSAKYGFVMKSHKFGTGI